MVKQFSAVFLAFCLVFLVSCNSETPKVSKDDYIDFYCMIAQEFGFSSSPEIFEDNSTFAFSAFDGVFSVGFTVDDGSFINYISVSTTESYGKTIITESQLHEALLWASYLIMPFYKSNYINYDKTDVATLAGILLASLEEDIEFEGMICTSKKNETGINITLIPV